MSAKISTAGSGEGSPRRESGWHLLDKERQLWCGEYKIPGLPCRSVAIPLKESGFLVVSPGAPLLESLPEELRSLGKAEILLAPNGYHHMGLKAWQQLYPDSTVVASEVAIKRLRKQGYDAIESLERLRACLPDGVRLVEPPGLRIGEVWLRIELERGVAWVICDAFFNMNVVSKKLRTRVFAKVMRSSPGLSVSNLMKWGGISRRRLYKKWLLEQIAADSPRALVPNHGDVLEGEGLPEQMRKVILKRL